MTSLAPHCPHRPPCPGCPAFGRTGVTAPVYDALAALCDEAGLPAPDVVEGPSFGYRHRARLAVRGRSASPKIGIFQEGTHRIVDVPRCLVHHPRINEVASALRTAIRQTGVAPYADAPHRGLLRYVQLVVERASQTVQVVLVGNGDDPAALAPLAAALHEECGPSLHGLWWNGNPERTNVILGPHWHRYTGSEAVRERIGGADVFFPPGAFGQTNLPLLDGLVAQMHAWIPNGSTVLELHAGTGGIGLGLLARCARVAFNEVSPDSLHGLGLGLAARPEVERERATVLPGAAAEHVGRIPTVGTVITDPPRKGLDDVVLEALVRDPPRRWVAVSCNPDAFLREARVLLDGGLVALRELVVFALFPHTEHAETVALFERA
jgi:tRNA/tmRNA/rRNA uracil-C5-methylase (TrmA/RlmC/RlmD family)